MRRLASLLVLPVLALGPSLVSPATARAAGTPSGDDLRELFAQTREQAADGDLEQGPALPTRAVVLDRWDDAVEPQPFGEPRRTTWAMRSADLRRVDHKTPVTRDGLLRVTTRWARLRGPRSSAVRQRAVTFLWTPGNAEVVWALVTSNAERPFLIELSEDSGRRVRPDVLRLERTPGVGGELTVRMSTEWLDVRRVRMMTTSQVREATDFTGRTPALRVGPARTTAPRR